MNYLVIFYVLGWVVFLEGVFMSLPLITALICGESTASIFAVMMVICMAAGYGVIRRKPKNPLFYAREGFVTVSLCWIVLSIIGALPFVISHEIPSFTNALFETISGFTTTGASILNDVEALSKSMLLWRSFTHWIGGMGVLVFILAIMPMAGGQTMHLMRAESPGPSIGKFVPKMRKTAFILYSIYFCLTLIELVLLLLGGVNFFEAITISFGTAGTGGFAVLSSSIASYSSYVQIVVTVFMTMFGINFGFYYMLILGKIKEAFQIDEVKWYLMIFVVASAAIAINIFPLYKNSADALCHSAFQVSSIMTTTGFATTNFDLWPQFSRTLLVMLMFSGACAGSTGGGIKVSRIIIYVKSVKKELSYLVHPRSVKILKMDGKAIPHDELRSVNIFLITYVILFSLSVLLLSFDGLDLITNFTAVAATINNIGPGLELVGPSRNFAIFSGFSKYILMFDMLAGRLEIFPLLLLFSPEAWRKK